MVSCKFSLKPIQRHKIWGCSSWICLRNPWGKKNELFSIDFPVQWISHGENTNHLQQTQVMEDSCIARDECWRFMGYSWRITGYYWIYLELFEYLWHVHSLSQFFGGHQFIYKAVAYLQIHLHGENYHKHWPFWGSKFWDNPKRKCQLNLHWDSMKCMQIISNKYWCWICIAVGFNQAQHMLLLSIQDHHPKQSSPRMDKL